jgi:hypothetical protein
MIISKVLTGPVSFIAGMSIRLQPMDIAYHFSALRRISIISRLRITIIGVL